MSIATAEIHELAPKQLSTQLKDALDAKRMRHVLSQALGETLSRVSVERALFSKSRPPVIHYQYQRVDDAVPRSLIGELVGNEARLYKESEIRRLGKARRSQIAPATVSPMFHADSQGLVLRRPGFDCNLLGLRLLHDKAFAIEMVAKAIGQPLAAQEFKVSLKAHRLGKRAVLLVECNTASGAARRVYIRLRPTTHEAGRAAFERHLRIAQAVKGATTVRIPIPLHFDADWGAAFFEELPGTPPEFTGLKSRVSGALAGKALAEWRNLTPVAYAQWSASDEIAGLTSWSAHLSEYLPRRLPAFTAALRVVSGRLANLPEIKPMPCHRDFHEAQLLVGDNTCGILDFDTWSDADPALDVGNFLAHIRLWELRNGADASQFVNAFIAASEQRECEFGNRVSKWRQAALLRLAAIYAFTSETDEIISQLITEAAA